MHKAESPDSPGQAIGASTCGGKTTKQRPGRPPKFTASEQDEVVRLYSDATTSTAVIREQFGDSRLDPLPLVAKARRRAAEDRCDS
jgi:hypothetical protein